MKYGADGVGLFRSEFLFMDRDALPTEDEQFEAYRTAAQTMAGKPLIIRTLDVGGDKKLPTLELPHEDNPFLGFRAIRMTLSHPEIFRPQLRAILRAAAYGDVRVMFPMIGSMDQLREAKALLREQEQTLQAEGVPTGPVKVGMMVEIPAAAVLAEEFAKEVDFFSIGTNDLTQYTLAVERGNAAVAHLYAPEHPAVLRLIAMTAQAAAERHIPCGMCGEGGWRPKLAPAFVGMGVNEAFHEPAPRSGRPQAPERADDGRVPSGRRKTSASVRKNVFRFSDGKILKNQLIFEHSDRKIEPVRKSPRITTCSGTKIAYKIGRRGKSESGGTGRL